MKILIWMFMGFDKHTTSEHLLLPIIEELCKNGHSVHIIQKDTNGTLPSIPIELSKYNIKSNTIKQNEIVKSNLIKRYLSDIVYVSKSKKFFIENYDAVFIQSNNVAAFAVKAIRKKFRNTNIVFNVQDIFPYNALYSNKLKSSSIAFMILSALQRYAYKNSNRIITISEDMKELLISDGVAADKIKVVYNWSYQNDVYIHDNMDFSCLSHIFDENYFNVVYAGNIGVMQNVEVIIETARLLKKNEDIWFHIIGDGVYAEKLKQKARDYKISNITFSPLQSSELAPYIYSMADVNLIPLIKNGYKTALPSKIATCLACQKPLILAMGLDSKFGEFIHEEVNCPVVDSEDSKSIAENILLIKDNKINCNTRVFFENYFGKKNIYQYINMITNNDN